MGDIIGLRDYGTCARMSRGMVLSALSDKLRRITDDHRLIWLDLFGHRMNNVHFVVISPIIGMIYAIYRDNMVLE